jgi:calcineurin-like phosphoesterase
LEELLIGNNMFSIKQKRDIADAVQKILRSTNHPELPKGEISFSLHVNGAALWSWANILNNGAVIEPDVNPWNEAQDTK